MHIGFRKCNKEQDRRRLIDKSKDEHIFDGNENMSRSTEEKSVDFELTHRNPTAGGVFSKKTNQVNPMLQNNNDNN